MEQNKLIAIIVVIAVIAAAAVGAVFLLKGDKSDGETSYTLKYVTNGGDAIDDKTFTKNTDTFNLATPVRSGGYTFLGWYENADFSGSPVTQVAKGTEKDITVYAKWQLVLAPNAIPTADQMSNVPDVQVTFNDAATDKTIPNAVVSAITADKTLTVVNKDATGKETLAWTFNGAATTQAGYNPAVAMDTTVTPDTSKLDTEKKITLDFEYDGTLPYASTIKFFIGTNVFPAGTLISVQNEGDAEPIGQFPVDAEGYVTFTIDHCSDWVLTQYVTITLNANGGAFNSSGVTTVVIGGDYNTDVPALPVPTRAGYNFVPWVSPVKFTEDLTLNAEWEGITYYIQYDANGGTGTVPKQAVTVGLGSTVFSSHGDMAKVGCDFTTWNTNADGSGKSYAELSEITDLLTTEDGATVTLYAQWEGVTYYIQYDANSGTGTLPRQVVTVGLGSTVFSSHGDMAKEGSTFGTWNTRADGTGTPYQELSEIPDSLAPASGETVTLYAQWIANTYTVRFNANGGTGTMADQAFTYGESQNLTANAFTSDTAAFNGWSDSATGTVIYANQALVNNLTAVNNAVVNLYAVWGAYNIAVNITLDGSAYEDLTVTAKKNDAGNAFALEYEGNGAYACRSGIEKNSDYALYVGNDRVGTIATSAQGSGSLNVAYFTVTFDLAGGTGSAPAAVVLFGNTVTEPQNISKTGNELAGWKNGNADWSFSTSTVTATTTLTAQWSPETYGVTLNANGGTINSGNVTEYTYGVATNLPTDITRAGYDFAGWYTNSQFSGESVSVIAAGEYGDKEYFAKWNLVAYTITFDAMGGTPVDSMTYNIETPTFDLPTDSTKTGYHITGWYVSDPESSITQIVQGTHENMALKANWAGNTYTITFNKNAESATGTMEPQTMTYGTSATLLNVLFQNAGSAFGGWATSPNGARVYGNCERVSNLTDVDGGNVNLYAVWEAYYIQVTVYVDNELDTTTIDNMVARHNAQDVPLSRVAVGVYKTSGVISDDTEYTILIGGEEVTTVSVYQGVGIGRAVYNTVTFYTHCDIQVPAQRVLYGHTAQQPQMAERVGYDFDCWSQDSYQRVPFDFANTPIGAARVLDAFWNAKTYTVTYNSNGGTGSMDNGTATFGEGFTPAACTFTKTVQDVDYRFVCWNTSANGQGMVFRTGSGTDIDEEVIPYIQGNTLTLYAIWTDSTYDAVVGDTFTGTYTYTSPNPNMTFNDMPTRCVVISAGDEVRVEVLMQEQGNWYVLTVGEYASGMWPVFGSLFDNAELASILSGQGVAEQQTINGVSVAVTKYTFTIHEGAATGYLCTVDETGMVSKIHIEMTVDEQSSEIMHMGMGTYTEEIVISTFVSGAAPETHSVTYLPDRNSEESDGTIRSCSTYLTADELQFSNGDKVFNGWYYTGAMGDDRIRYVPGERVLTDRTVYADWITPNTNICWDVTNLLPDMQILLNGTADAWPQDAALNDYLTFPGTSGWSAAAENYTYNFTYNQHSYKMYILPEVIGGNGSVFQCATPSIVDGNLRLTFDRNNGDGKFYVTFSIYDVSLPDFAGYNPHVGDTFTYTFGGYDYTYTVTKVPGSDGWAYTDMYQYSATVMGNTSNYTNAMYEYPVAAPTTGMYLVSQGVYDFNGQNVDCYVVSMKQITQASGQRATHILVEDYVGIADGLPYSTMTDMGYGSTTYVLQSKSNVEAVAKHTVTFNGNGGTVDGKASDTMKVYGTNGLNVYREGYTFLGWANSPDTEVIYGDHSVITSDCTLYAKWDFGGAHLATDGGNGTPSGSATMDLLNFSDSIKVYPHSFGYVLGNQVGTTFTIDGFMTVGETTVSPTFKYVTVVCINPEDITNSMSQVASHVYVNTTMFNTYVDTMPESIVLCVERNYTLTLDVGYGDKTDITYHANSGTGQDVQDVGPRNGAIILKPSDTFSKENYRFLGWATSPSGVPMQSQGVPYETMPNLIYGNIDNGASVDLYAIWEPYVHITYDANGGTYENPDYDYSKYVKADGETVYEISDGYFLHRNGFTLIGWSSDPNPVGEVMLKYVGGDKVTFPEEQTGMEMILYAYWAPSEDTFSVYYDKNADFIYMWHYPDQYDPLSLVAEVKMPIAKGSYEFANTPTAVLIGWNTAADGSGTAYGLNGYIQVKQKPQGDYVLYAMWKTTATVHFEANGGMGYMENIQATFGSNTQLPDNAFERDGYTFTGWTIQGEDPGYHAFISDIMGHYYLYVDTTYPEITLLANWSQTHTVTFFPNEGEFYEPFDTVQTVAHGQTLGVPGISKEHFNFYGWVLEDNTIVDFSQPIERDLTVYARWVFTVHFYQWDQGEEDWVENQEYLNEEVTQFIALPQISVTWYEESANWNTESNGEGTAYEANTQQAIAHDGTEVYLYEVHVLKTFTIYFDSNGSEDEFEPNVFHYGDDIIIEVGEPYIEGYTFTGWYDMRNPERPDGPFENGDDLSELFGFPSLTLTAQYTPVSP